MTEILLIGPEPDKMPRLKLTYKCLKSLGHDVRVFAPFARKGNTIIRYLANMVKLLFERSEQYHYFNIPDVIGLPLIFKRGRFVYDVRSPWKEVVEDITHNKYLGKLTELIEKVLSRKADAVVSANPLLGERAVMYGAKDFVNVPNFVYQDMSTEGWEDIRKQYKKKNGKVDEALVLFFGKVSKVEGSRVLADIIRDTLAIDYDLFNVRFLILGDGPELSTLKKAVKDAGLEDRVHFLGWVNHEEVGKYIKAADLCVMPREEYGTTIWMHPDCVWKVNESLSIGTSVIGTGWGGFGKADPIHGLILIDNSEFPGTILNVAEVALRWGDEDSKLPVKRDWKVSREELKKVYGNG